MSLELTKRDYSLIGSETKRAEARGLADAQWYTSPIPRKRLRELTQRRDGPAGQPANEELPRSSSTSGEMERTRGPSAATTWPAASWDC